MNIIKIAVLALFLTFLSLSAWAQGGPPGTPIDGGLSALLAAGGIYGFKKLMGKKR